MSQNSPNRPRHDTDAGDDFGTGVEILDRPDSKTKRPKMHIVFLHNDPYTPREFVVAVLMRFFQKTLEQATKVMMLAHTEGMSAAGIYTQEIAETKAMAANSYCRAEGRPLHFSVQEE